MLAGKSQMGISAWAFFFLGPLTAGYALERRTNTYE